MPDSIGITNDVIGLQKKYEAMFFNNQVIMLLVDPESQSIAQANQAAINYYGWSQEAFQQKKIHDFFLLDDNEIKLKIQDVMVKKQQYLVLQHRLANKEIRDVEVFSSILDHKGKTLLLSIIHDITTLKQVEKDKIDIESMYRTIIEQATEALFIHDIEGNFIQVNQQACDSVGYRKDELLQMSIYDIDPDFDLARAQKAWANIKPGEPFTLECNHKRKNGTLFPVEIRFGTSTWKGMKIFVSLVRDISKRVQAEKELRATQVRFQTAFDYSAVAACIFNMEGMLLFVNRAMGELLGYEPEHLLHKNIESFSHPDDHNIGKKYIQLLLENKETSVSYEKRYIHQSGKIIWANVTLALLRNEDNDPIHLIAQIQNITIKKEATEAIDKHRRNLQLFIEYAPAAIAMLNTDLEFISASQRFYTDYGLEDKNIVGKSYYSVFPEIPERWKQIFNRTLTGATESCEEDSFLRKNGKLEWIRWEIHPWYENNTEIGGIILFSEVITEKKKSEKRINTQVKRLKSLRSIDMAIINSFDITTMLNVLLDSLLLTLEVDAADVLLFDPITNTLFTETHKGFLSPRNLIENVPLDKVLAGDLFLSRKTAFLANIQGLQENTVRKWLITEENFVSYIGIPLVAKGQIKGMLEVFHRSELKPDTEWMEFLESLAGQAAIAIDNSQIYENMRRINLNLSLAYEGTIESWSSALDLRDKEPAGHTQHLAELTTKLCKAMNMNETETTHARRGALLHDIGKLIIPDDILLKPGPLSNEEWEIIRKHPEYAYEILSSIEYLSPALEIPYNHHERWNGSGYPRGIKEKQIPLSARIFSVIDVWDALTSPRPFRAAWLEEDALKYIQQGSGKLFDPEVVKSFIKIMQP